MSNCCNCLAKFAKKCFISHISWMATLIVATTLTTLTAFVQIYGLSKVWRFVFVILMISTIISYIILIFSFFASRCGRSKHKLTLGIILIIYGVLILIFAISFGSLRKELVKRIDDSFNNADYSGSEIEKIENSFNCCGTSFCQGRNPDRENCHDRIDSLMNKITNGGIASSIVLVLLIWIAAVFCLIDSKVFSNEDNEGSLLKSDLEQPILAK